MFRSRSVTYCFNDIVDQLLSLVNLILSICHDEAVKILFLVASMSCVRSAFAFFN